MEIRTFDLILEFTSFLSLFHCGLVNALSFGDYFRADKLNFGHVILQLEERNDYHLYLQLWRNFNVVCCDIVLHSKLN